MASRRPAQPSRPDLRHVTAFIPDHFKQAAHHAREVARAAGQAKFQHTKSCIRHLLEGLTR